MLVTGVAEPTPLVLDADTISVPNDFANDVVDLTSSVLPVREGGRVFTTAVANIFSAFINEMKTKAAYANLAYPDFYGKLVQKKPSVPSDARLPGS